MRESLRAHRLAACLSAGAALLHMSLHALAATPEAPEPTRWPHTIKAANDTLTIYQPQLEKWDGFKLTGRAAVSATQGTDDAHPTFGIVSLAARTLVDKQSRLVTLDQVQVTGSQFPSAPEHAARWKQAIEKDAAGKQLTLALEQLEANLEIHTLQNSAQASTVRNDPPRIVFSSKPALLVYVDGTPSFKPLPNTAYERLINTRPLIVKNKSGTLYLRLFDGWMTASALNAAWTVATNAPADLQNVLKLAIESRQVDLLTGQSDPEQPGPSLAKGPVPMIHVATEPTELIVTDGEPKWTTIPGTQLLFVENTTGHIFKLVSDQKTYLLVSGRWFRAPSTSGPWQFVPADKLAKDFANIPNDNAKENVKASVAGTPQAQEAAIAATIPETAAVKASEAKLTPPKFDGEPKLAAIKGTPLQYVVNTATPIVMIDAKTYYAVENAVWFSATSVKGPWVVARTVPAVVYTIPPDSPLHYVTYARIYNVEGDTIYVGYTPAYEGTCVDPVTHVVVYGTGYPYTPWVGSVWYGPPVTYGFGVAIRYTPWTGWTVGFGFGWSWGAATVVTGWGWGAYPWWGPYGWHGGSWAATTGNVYRRWGSTASVSRASGGYNAWTGNRWASQAGMSYNSRTGTLAAGQRGAVTNIYTGDTIAAGRGVTYDRDTGEVNRAGYVRGENGTLVNKNGNLYAGHDGNVYRHTDDGWQQADRGGEWKSSKPATTPSATQTQLDRDRSARDLGAERYSGRAQTTRSMSRGGGRRR